MEGEVFEDDFSDAFSPAPDGTGRARCLRETPHPPREDAGDQRTTRAVARRPGRERNVSGMRRFPRGSDTGKKIKSASFVCNGC